MPQTLEDLRRLAAEYPDAPKWWVGDWANAAERFDVALDAVPDTANAAASDLRGAVLEPGGVSLPSGVEADAVSLSLPPTLKRDEWEFVGGVVVLLHDETAPPRVPKHARFKFGDVYPADDVLSEWLVTISMAANDLVAVTVQGLEAQDVAVSWYFARATFGHFYEVASKLDAAADVPEIKAFVASLPQDARHAYVEVLAHFRPHREQLFNVRNTVFHYPQLMNPSEPGALRSRRALLEVLREVANGETGVRFGKIKDGRLIYADMLTYRLVVRQVGGWKNFEKLQKTVEEAIAAFMRFIVPALEEHLIRRQQAGASVTYELGDEEE